MEYPNLFMIQPLFHNWKQDFNEWKVRKDYVLLFKSTKNAEALK